MHDKAARYETAVCCDAVLTSCPYCGSNTRQVKAGTNNGTQRYKCGNCQRRYSSLVHKVGYPEAIRAQAVELHARGNSIRAVARQLGINHQSVARWVQQQYKPPVAEPDIVSSASIAKQRPTIRDVAGLAGVSISSVSNFLNEKGRMADATRQRIRTAMQELHFTPNALVRAIQQRRTGILGVMLHSLDRLDETEGPRAFLVPALLRGINDGANAAGNDLLLYTSGHLVDCEELESRFLDGHIDGLIWMTPGKQTPLLDRLIAAGLPTVALLTHEVPKGISYVTVDNRDGMRQLVAHLVEQGHQHVAYVGPDWSTDFRDRHTGYRDAMIANGLTKESRLQIVTKKHPFLPEDCERILTTLLALSNPPTAILCGNDHIAAQLAESIQARGLRIPDDLAIAGFDDMPLAAHVAGGLTTIHQPFRRMGKLAAENLLALINGKSRDAYQTVLPTELIVRASTQRTIG